MNEVVITVMVDDFNVQIFDNGYCWCFFEPPAVAGGSYELGSILPSFHPSVWKFSWDRLNSFF